MKIKDIASDIERLQDIQKSSVELLEEIIATLKAEHPPSVTMEVLRASDLLRRWGNRAKTIKGRLKAIGWRDGFNIENEGDKI